MKSSHAIDWGKTAAEIQDDYAAVCRERDDLILEKDELQRQLDERGGVLELHRIRIDEIERDLIRTRERVEQVALALDVYFSHERGLDPYIDELNQIAKGGAA